jgi:zinc/manganese transport system permease protein
MIQLTAFSAALLGALALYFCERRWLEILEAVIGTSFVLAASAAILILANNPHGGEQLKDLLVGQVLWVDLNQLLPVCWAPHVMPRDWLCRRCWICPPAL